MLDLDNYVLAFDAYFPFLYSVLFFVSIGVLKRTTSLALTVLVLALAEFTMSAIRDPVWAFASDQSINYEVRLAAWYGCWFLCNIVIAFVIQYIHVWLNITRGREASIILLVRMGFVVMHFISYFNQAFLDVQVIETVYQIGIPMLNLGVAVFLLYSMLRSLINVDINIAVRRNGND